MVDPGKRNGGFSKQKSFLVVNFISYKIMIKVEGEGLSKVVSEFINSANIPADDGMENRNTTMPQLMGLARERYTMLK